MHAAGDFAGREQAGDGRAVRAQHLGAFIDADAAHRVMDARGHLDGVEGSGIQRIGEGDAAEVRVRLGGDLLVPVVHGGGKGVRRDADFLSQRFIAVRRVAEVRAALDVALDDGGSIRHLLIDDQPAEGAGLGDFRRGNHVAGADFVDEALALGVDQDRAVAAQTLGDQGRGIRLHGGMDLDLVHIDGVRAGLHGHGDALALRAGGVGGHEAVQRGLIGGDHRQVRAEAAGSQDDGLGVHHDLVAALAHGMDADGGSAFIQQDFIGGGVGQDRDVFFGLAGGLQAGHDVSAHGEDLAVLVHRTMDALDGSAAEGSHVVQLDADGAQPLDGAFGLGSQGVDQGGVVQALAADDGVQLKQLHAVKIPFGRGLVGCVLLGNRLGQGSHRLIVRVAFRSLELLFDARVLGEGVLVLVGSLGGVHAAGGLDGVAAHGVLAFQHQDLEPLIRGGQGGGHAGPAGADDDDVRVVLSVFQGFLFGLFHVVVGIDPGVFQGLTDRRQDGVGGDGGAGNGVHVDGVVLGHQGGQLLDGDAADAGGFLRALGGDGGDDAVRQFNGDGDLAVQAHRGGGAGDGFRHRGNHGQRQQQAQRQREKTFAHDSFSFSTFQVN